MTFISLRISHHLTATSSSQFVLTHYFCDNLFSTTALPPPLTLLLHKWERGLLKQAIGLVEAHCLCLTLTTIGYYVRFF